MKDRRIIRAVLALVLWIVSAGHAPACEITLHTPNGHSFKVRHPEQQIGMIRSVMPGENDHLAPNTNTVLLIGGRHQGVRETEQEIERLERCEKPRPAPGKPKRPPEYPAEPGPRG